MKLPVFFVALLLTASSAIAEEAKSFAQTLSLQGVTFKVNATNNGSINKLIISADGLKKKAKPIEREIEGTVTGAEVADLNADGSPEIYVYITSAGSGSYGSLVAYSTNRKKSLSEIYLPDLSDDKINSKGYLGHDQFTVIEQTLARRFPVYKRNDTNSNPTGGIRQLEYTLTRGEAGWLLRLKKGT